MAGTAQGITAMQLDIKLQGGVPLETLCEGIHLAAVKRKLILGAFLSVLSSCVTRLGCVYIHVFGEESPHRFM